MCSVPIQANKKEMEITDFFDIFYKLENSEGVTEFCDYMNYGQSKRYRMNHEAQLIVMRRSCCGFAYTLRELTGKTRVSKSYKAKYDYREYSSNNGVCRSSLEIDGNKITHTQQGKKRIVVVREFSPTHMITTFIADDSIVAKKYYRAINVGYVK